jgi:para-aminobenzoate synthetase component I
MRAAVKLGLLHCSRRGAVDPVAGRVLGGDGRVIEEIRARRVTIVDPASRPRTTPSLRVAVSPIVTGIDFSAEAAAERLRDLPGLIFLDSSRPGGEMGRYSYVTADPFLVLSSRGRTVEINSRSEKCTFDANPWEVLQHLVARYRIVEIRGLPPFQGSAAGYLGYDLGRHLERLPALARADRQSPDLSLGFYDWVFSQDHLDGRSRIFTTGLPTGTPAASRLRRDQILSWLSWPGTSADGSASPGSVHLRSNVGRA